MPEWFDGVAQEWSLIGAAPISFAIALVVVIIVVWAILHWFHRRMLSSKDIRIEVLQSRLADYRNVLEGASPREAAYKITQLKGKLEAIKGVPRDENTIYQKGKRIGGVVGVRIDVPNNSVVFDRMTRSPAISTRQVTLSSKTWFWLSSAWKALARPDKAARYSTPNFLSSATAEISDRRSALV